jgi:hypothetical protein
VTVELAEGITRVGVGVNVGWVVGVNVFVAASCVVCVAVGLPGT